ncbi:DUF6462 family protein [Acetatifactor aquisgranensis]|uniref:DUF6462 family protein n=1 Tax=Acetatifactor aquisgranensis TaxID=2941233 RepID=UPI00203D7543|nr:DUF6462 family protein [Acetatifactor aquisgranensis]
MNELKNRNFNGELLTYQQAAEKSNMGINTVMKLAKESGALVKIGKIARVDWNRFYNYILSVYQVSE